jgi:perosamine synthetase
MINLFRSTPTGEEIDALKDVLLSGWWAMGSKVEEFEKEWAKFTGAKYAVATNSCTSALDIAVRVVKLGDEISVSPFTFVSSALCILNAGKRVKFVDIDEETLCTPKADIQVLFAGNDSGQGTIYDMAHAGGLEHKGLISCWSFHAVKNLPTGDGGMLTTNDSEIYRRAKALSWCGIDKSTFDRSKNGYSWDYNIQEVGLKANMNDITAAIGLCQIKKLKERNEFRARVARWYDKYLPPEIKRPYPSSSWHMYTIRVKNRDELYNKLKVNGVSAGVHYKPLYKYPIFPRKVLPITEKVSKEIITLPMHLELTENDVKFICSLI